MRVLQTIRQATRYAYFSEAKPRSFKSHSQTLIINQNLRFSAQQFDMFLVPSHPKIITKGFNYFEIDVNSRVAELAIVSRPKPYGIVKEDFSQLWAKRTSFQLNFNQLNQLLDLQTGSNNKVKIQKNDNLIYYILDVNSKNEVQFIYAEKAQGKQQYSKFKISLQAEEFNLLQFMIKESLFDMSGLGFIFETRKKEQVEIVKKEINLLMQRQQQVNQFYAQ